MPSVTSLDQDMRNLRRSRYTPEAANECRAWIEQVLQETLPAGDLLRDVLKDGSVLCRLANLLLPPPGLKYKKSPMPFIQMENISHFLRACQSPPLNMHAHDRFLTVDLFESKDPAQVLQCISAFSRVANTLDPSVFPTTIGPQKRGATLSPSTNGSVRSGPPGSSGYTSTPTRPSSSLSASGPLSPALTGNSATSRAADSGLKSVKGTVSSWSKKSDEGNTSPAWNIHQYGYMGGASQGNQGVAFGARRQITTAAPHVPSFAEKERKRKEKEAAEERARLEAEQLERQRQTDLEADKERERLEEERRWEQETRRVRDEEKRRIEEQKRQWEEQEQKWQVEEEARLQEEAEVQKRLGATAPRTRATSDARLQGQLLSQYQAEQASSPLSPKLQEDTPEARRVRELEKQLEEARERERKYQLEREERARQENNRSQPEAASLPDATPRSPSPKDSEASWAPDEREYLQRKWQSHQPSARDAAPSQGSRPLPQPSMAPSLPIRTLHEAGPDSAARPLPTPEDHKPAARPQNRTDQFLAENPAPGAPKHAAHQPAEMGYTSTYEEQADRERRLAGQQKTKAGGWASKSLLEREMERERERQREWEANQKAVKSAGRDTSEGSGPGQTWDVNQYGFTAGDSQNRGSSSGSGIALGGRRQIIGPRPLP